MNDNQISLDSTSNLTCQISQFIMQTS